MISASAFLESLKNEGFKFFTGVPCSFLTPIINRVIDDPGLRYVSASSEGEAVAIASGAWLSGRQTVFMCQNSGLGNAVNPLTSLNYPFRIPTLVLISRRGGPGLEDEPQHELMGEITPKILDTIKVLHAPFPKCENDIANAITIAREQMNSYQLPFAFIMNKDDVMEYKREAQSAVGTPVGSVEDKLDGMIPSRYAALERMLSVVPENAAIIATTGKCGRELFTITDREQHFYQVGSMGCGVAMGLGCALNSKRPIIVLDGDGGALMKLGALATVGADGPKHLIHIVLDNGTYDSTGGQPTNSINTDFAAIAVACGYPHGYRCDGLLGFGTALASALGMPGPHLIHLKIEPGSRSNLGRPTIRPVNVARRFRAFLTEG
ncbi:MAG: phosphonopyruvate decarboxylase [Magnetovibrio sp.]|nr:phosphonopyruvate decarboxylase [Magnetovibrio sp.]